MSDAINVQRHVKWILMCARLQIIQNVYDAVLASRLVRKDAIQYQFLWENMSKKNAATNHNQSVTINFIIIFKGEIIYENTKEHLFLF